MLSILLAAMLPYGAVAVWAQTLTGLLCMILAAAMFLLFRCTRQEPVSVPGLSGFRVFAGWLVIITAMHLVKALTSGSLGALETLSTTLFLWSAWGGLVAVVVVLSGSTSTLRLLFTGIVAIATAQAVFAVIGLYTPFGFYLNFGQGSRAVGTFSSGNSLGGFLALSLPPTFVMTQLAFVRAYQHIQVRGLHILHDAKREDYCLVVAILWMFAALAQSIALILSGSRGAIIASAAALTCLVCWMLFDRNSGGRQRLSATVGILGALLLVLAIGVGGTYALTVNRLLALDAASEVALPRTEIWKGTLQLVKKYPLGVGPGGFSSAFLPFQPQGFGGARVYHAHNDYLELMAETGIPGVLLLLFSMGILLKTTIRRQLVRQQGESVWFRRAAFLSVAAGCLHAVVDFNLSSRPGVAALFFCLLGVSVSRHNYAGLPGEEAPHDVNVCRKKPLCRRRFVIAILCVLLALNQLRLATASVFMEQGFAAVSGETPLYFWIPMPALTEAQAMARLRLARRLAPDSAEAHLLWARALVFENDHAIESAIRTAKEKYPGEQRIVEQTRILMRLEERRMLLQARAAADTAIRRFPGNPDAAVCAADIAARLASLVPAGERMVEIRRALAGVARARLLAPRDATVCHTLLDIMERFSMNSALFEEPAMLASVQKAATEIGNDLLRLEENDMDRLLNVWSRLRMDPLAVIRSESISPTVAWSLYRLYNRQRHAEAALQMLNLLEQNMAAETRSSSRFHASSAADVYQRFYPYLIRERARWALRQQRFDDYRQSRPARAEVLRMEVEQALVHHLPSSAALHSFRYLELKKLADTRGLDPDHATELRALMLQYGESETAAAKVLPVYADPTLEPEGDPSVSETGSVCRLELQLLGGRIEFTGFSVEKNSIRTVWRFRGSVPSDLQVVFSFRDHLDEPVTSASFRFVKEWGRAFGVGNVTPGTVFQAVTPIPATAGLSDNLQIGVRRISTGRWLPSLEGLPFVEIFAWKTLPQAGSSLRNAD